MNIEELQAKTSPGPLMVGIDGDGILSIFSPKSQPGYVGGVVCRVAPPNAMTQTDLLNAARLAHSYDMLPRVLNVLCHAVAVRVQIHGDSESDTWIRDAIAVIAEATEVSV